MGSPPFSNVEDEDDVGELKEKKLEASKGVATQAATQQLNR